jgi:dTDP-4-amino-4,6-dideoxygalactose transaminase
MYEIGEEEIEAVARVIRSGRLFRYGTDPNGPPTETHLFEREFAESVRVEHSLALTSGTAALIAGLVGMGVEPGDEVIAPGFGFVATALAPLAMGAVPVLAEVDETLMLDPVDLQKKVTPRTRAIIPVHVLGHIADMASIIDIAKEHDLLVLEDCAQSCGGEYRGRPVGSLGAAGAFSFNQFKTLTAGEGGALTTGDANIIQRARVYHDVGCATWPNGPVKPTPWFGGVTYRMDEIRSAVLRVQLKRLPSLRERLRSRWTRLRAMLDGICELLPVNDEAGDCGATILIRLENRKQARAFHAAAQKRKLPVTLPFDMERHSFFQWEPLMQRRGAHHPRVDPLHITEAGRAQRYAPDMLPRTIHHLERTAALAIDIHWTDDDVRNAADAVRNCLRSKS